MKNCSYHMNLSNFLFCYINVIITLSPLKCLENVNFYLTPLLPNRWTHRQTQRYIHLCGSVKLSNY